MNASFTKKILMAKLADFRGFARRIGRHANMSSDVIA